MKETARIVVPALLCAVLTACGSEPGGLIIEPPVDTADSAGHPLVPDEYTYYWNTRGCTTEDGDVGAQVYWLGSGSADSGNGITVTERWYWFFGEDDWGGDCRDTFELTGAVDADADLSIIGCPSCDGAWAVQRSVVELNCMADYSEKFGVAQPEDGFEAHLLLDAVTTTGEINSDNEMLVVHAQMRDEAWVTDPGYASGHAFPQGESPWPATVDWLGSACVGLDVR